MEEHDGVSSPVVQVPAVARDDDGGGGLHRAQREGELDKNN